MRRISFYFMVMLSVFTSVVFTFVFYKSPFTGILATKSKELIDNQFYINSFFVHVFIGSIALGIGWLGFVEKVRTKYIFIHKIIGRIYVFSFLITAVCSLPVSLNAYGGLISQIGFTSISLLAIITTAMGFISIINNKIDAHMKWMHYSYACCLATVTLRIWSPILSLIVHDEIVLYNLVSWLSWLPNLLFVKYYLTRHKNI